MPSGYEKSPDYGDPPPNWGGDWLIVALFLAAIALAVWIIVP